MGGGGSSDFFRNGQPSPWKAGQKTVQLFCGAQQLPGGPGVFRLQRLQAENIILIILRLAHDPVDLPAEKNAAGEFVFTDYPYWEKSE